MNGQTLYLGWDVGAWHCDRNRDSRDALAVVAGEAGEARPVGRPWRGNLRETLSCYEGMPLVQALVSLCEAPADWNACVIAIDTPLAWPSAFQALLGGEPLENVAAESGGNAYLFRYCERELIRRGLRPMSPIVQQIGSQAVKGQHFLVRAGLTPERLGVWSGGGGRVQAIEAYPSGIRRSTRALRLYEAVYGVAHERRPGERGREADLKDARLCALAALLFDQAPESLFPPCAGAPFGEGWIWVPKDGLSP